MTPAESPDSALPLRRLPALFVASGTALFAELLVIRWESCEIPVLAYFKNFPLLAVFIGLGAGCLLAGRRTSRWTASLWALAALSLVLAFAHRMQLDAIVFPEARLAIWSHEVAPGGGSDLVLLARNLGIIFGLLALNAASFVGLGQAIGGWLSAGAALPAYNADVAGSLAGVVAFAACAWWQTPPVVWLLTAVAGLALTAASVDRLRGSLLPLAAIVAIAVLRAGRADEPGALVRWSPYYRIQVMKSFATPPPNEVPLVYRVDVNRDYHQAMADIADRRE